MSTVPYHRHTSSSGGPGPLWWAWVALLSVPIFAIVAFVLAEVLYSVTGHDPSAETPPHWADAVALVPAGLVFVLPCALAMIFGHRAVLAGHRSGWVPVGIAVGLTAGYVVLNLI